MTQFRIQVPLQFVRTSLKCSVKYLKISAYAVRSIVHFHNAPIKESTLIFLVLHTNDSYSQKTNTWGFISLSFIAGLEKSKQQQQEKTPPFFFLLSSHSHVPHPCITSTLLINCCFTVDSLALK